MIQGNRGNDSSHGKGQQSVGSARGQGARPEWEIPGVKAEGCVGGCSTVGTAQARTCPAVQSGDNGEGTHQLRPEMYQAATGLSSYL